MFYLCREADLQKTTIHQKLLQLEMTLKIFIIKESEECFVFNYILIFH